MKETAYILQQVLATELLAPSVSRLAEILGYQGRTTLYRLREGTASDKAIHEFCKRLKDTLYVSDDSLREMYVTVTNASRLSALMKDEMNTAREGWQRQVLLAFVSRDFDCFSPRFRDEELGALMKLETEDADSFYNMLAWFYVKAVNFDFYTKGLTHRQRCAAMIEPVGRWLMGIYPENSMAEQVALTYSMSDIHNAEAETLWSGVKSFALMLECFANPDILRKTMNKLYKLPGIGSRSYWRGNTDEDTVILMSLNMGELPGSGYYDVYHVKRNGDGCRSVCKLLIMSDEILSLVNTSGKNPQLGVFGYDGERLSFTWEKENDDPTESGNLWHRLPLENSASLRELDRSVSDETLFQATLLAEGIETVEGMEVVEVILSRHWLRIYLKNKTSYKIDRNRVPFLKHVSPDMPIGIYRRIEDGDLYVVWLTLKQTLPLSFFQKDDS